MPEVQPKQITELLDQWKAGDQAALNVLLPLVYDELRRLAHQQLRKERSDHTIQSTALVHEAYLRLKKRGNVQFENRSHFLAICSQLMRQILVEYARGRRAAKREGGYKVTLDEAAVPAKARNVDLVLLDDALNELEKLDLQQSRIVELRYFGGLSIEETSEVLKVSPATVKRDWATARAWLLHQIKRTGRHDSGETAHKTGGAPSIG
jgi:RNA polymerase sigma factor (TIGR02999 family)